MSEHKSHREIGNELKLFMFHKYSPGSCFFLPHGTRIYNNLINFMRYCYDNLGYQEVITPHLLNKKLWMTSGHWDKYKDNMFLIQHHHHFAKDEENDEVEELSICAMNCPKHCLMFKNIVQSYNNLPLRLADFGVLHRNELSGALTGLTRVRKFQQDDAHIFCTIEQIDEEIENYLLFLKKVYEHFGLEIDAELSTRPENYIGNIEIWNKAEEILKNKIQVFPNWKIDEGSGAFYGPKIDIKVKDSLNRYHQCATIQLDFNLPERFDLTYLTSDNQYKRPVMIHRAILGSVERFMAILLEHTNGNLPFWLSPRQICIIPVSNKYNEYANEIKKYFKKYYIDIDNSGDMFNKKIRNAEVMKYSYIFIIGEKEQNNKTISIRNNNKTNVKSIDEALKNCNEEYNKKYIYE